MGTQLHSGDADARQLARAGLVRDRALRPGDRDLFAHDDYVDALEDLLDEEIESANIALYGSWGAGKSGIAKRLRHRLENGQHKDSVVFVELNAAKYARAPLLRHFIIEIARQTGGRKRAAAYRQKLYAHITRQDLNAPREWLKALRVGLWGFVAVVIVDIVLLLTLSGEAKDAVAAVSRFLLPTAVSLAAIAKFAIQVLPLMTATLHVEAPATEEQFEEVFVELLDELQITGEDDRRLVVLIDELDRCSPQQVADTLESLRTFLDVPGCVFIVAADQQALEHGLTLRVRQATPADPTNPYYSAGSAYLDKIFEYQIGLPPLQPSRLVDFAIELVRDADGVWAELPDLDRVLSVLIPVHVQSPRRVKVLLNRFALAYGIAKKRAAAGKLDANLAARAEELAKLVCLRTEFPLFVADLEADWRIPDLVLRWLDLLETGTTEQDSVLDTIDPGLRERARLYAMGRLPVAELLAEERPGLASIAAEIDAAMPADAGSADDDRPARSSPDNPDTGATGDARPVELPGEHGRVTAVHRTHGLQLVEYLQKTRRVVGPRPDLIHLEGAGAVVGIDPAAAQRIQLLALNNQAEAVAAALARLDQSERPRALSMLAGQLRAAKGNDADNIAHCLLRALAVAGEDISGLARTLAPDIGEYARRGEFEPQDLPAALLLGVLGEHAGLVAFAMERDELGSNLELRRTALTVADRLVPKYDATLARIVADEALGGDGEQLAQHLVALPGGVAEPLLVSAQPLMREGLDAMAVAAEPPAATAQPSPAPGAVRTTPPAPDEDAIEALTALVKRYSGFVRALTTGDARRLAELALVPLIQTSPGREPLYELQIELQRELGRAQTSELSDVLLKDVGRWVISSWPSRLRFIDPALVSSERGGAALDGLALELWKHHTADGDASAPEHEAAAVAALAALIRAGLTTGATETTAAVVADVSAPSTGSDVPDRVALIERAVRFRDAGLVDAGPLADAALAFVTALGQAALPAEVDTTQTATTISALVQAHAAHASSEVIIGTLEAVSASAWIGSPTREALLLALTDNAEATSSPLSPADLARLVSDHGVAASPAVEIWLTRFEPSPSEAAQTLGPLAKLSPRKSLRQAIDDYSAKLDAGARAELVLPWLRAAFGARPNREFLAAARFDEADEERVTACLADLASEAENAEYRETVMRLWDQLAPGDDHARRRLVREVMIPFSAQGVGAYELVRRHLKLAVPPPHGTKGELVSALETNAPDERRASAMGDRMTDLGLLARKRKRFGIFGL